MFFIFINQAVDVLASSIEYGLDELRRLSILYLVENLSIKSSCQAIQAAVMYGQDDLKHKALDYIARHTKVSVLLNILSYELEMSET